MASSIANANKSKKFLETNFPLRMRMRTNLRNFLCAPYYPLVFLRPLPLLLMISPTQTILPRKNEQIYDFDVSLPQLAGTTNTDPLPQLLSTTETRNDPVGASLGVGTPWR